MRDASGHVKRVGINGANLAPDLRHPGYSPINVLMSFRVYQTKKPLTNGQGLYEKGCIGFAGPAMTYSPTP